MSGPSFQYSRAANVHDALTQASRPGTAFLAGGTDLLQLWKAGAMAPAGVVDISRLPLDDVEFIDGRLSLGALARLSDVATHPDVTRYHPLIAKAILASASGQIRNMATAGGNLLQRTRCPYFRSEELACNKRTPGSGCGALAGENRQAALFGASASCVATHASDLAVALMALDAEVEVFGAEGQRRFPLRDLYRLPAETPERETNLTAGELVPTFAFRMHPALPLVRPISKFAIVRRSNSPSYPWPRCCTSRTAGSSGRDWPLAASHRYRGGSTGVKRYWSAVHPTPKPSPPPAIWPSSTPDHSPTTDSRSRCCAMP
jgi:CO/xanthine dehydrogenase FAD-binding subunit